uniref:Uncharacterized protein n=1 Tax=Ciona intestinalis TaxID=7719 RepID=H2XL95_CIOIN
MKVTCFSIVWSENDSRCNTGVLFHTPRANYEFPNKKHCDLILHCLLLDKFPLGSCVTSYPWGNT